MVGGVGGVGGDQSDGQTLRTVLTEQEPCSCHNETAFHLSHQHVPSKRDHVTVSTVLGCPVCPVMF